MYKSYKLDISAARDDTATLDSFYCTRATNRTPQQQEMIQLHYIAFTCTVECTITSQELQIFAF